uniref:cytochrome c oxidase subunit III n=1 Tax=Stigmaeopsis continentalis TaxID=2547534 RepID=UPI00286BB8DD|nr:cytochrome c oxidase subunit III [Stigmaeopsis continentalis]WKW93599.1 cytochrome c oxidase subunit III [Stigmaeopsis continentalis]
MLKSNFMEIKLSSSPILFTMMLFIFLNSMNNLMWLLSNYYLTIMMMLMFFMYLTKMYFNMMLNENFLMGKYHLKKKNILANGFILFIMSEMMVFISLFWSYIHNAFSSNTFMGNFWPPKGVTPANPTSMIIFGTSILLSSSIIIMFCHQLIMMKNNKKKSMYFLMMCLIMGLIFIDMQILEMSNFYMKLNFNFNDSIFSSSFLFTTSLHASHVVLGLMGLFMSFNIMKTNNNNMNFYMNMEMSIWYWHFVDYIWIVVFTMF